MWLSISDICLMLKLPLPPINPIGNLDNLRWSLVRSRTLRYNVWEVLIVFARSFFFYKQRRSSCWIDNFLGHWRSWTNTPQTFIAEATCQQPNSPILLGNLSTKREVKSYTKHHWSARVKLRWSHFNRNMLSCEPQSEIFQSPTPLTDLFLPFYYIYRHLISSILFHGD